MDGQRQAAAMSAKHWCRVCAAPTDIEPAKAEAVRRIEKDYPKFEVTVHFGFLFRAVRRNVSGTPIPVDATTEDELRRRLDVARSIAKCAVRDASARQLASEEPSQ